MRPGTTLGRRAEAPRGRIGGEGSDRLGRCGFRAGDRLDTSSPGSLSCARALSASSGSISASSGLSGSTGGAYPVWATGNSSFPPPMAVLVEGRLSSARARLSEVTPASGRSRGRFARCPRPRPCRCGPCQLRSRLSLTDPAIRGELSERGRTRAVRLTLTTRLSSPPCVSSDRAISSARRPYPLASEPLPHSRDALASQLCLVPLSALDAVDRLLSPYGALSYNAYTIATGRTRTRREPLFSAPTRLQSPLYPYLLAGSSRSQPPRDREVLRSAHRLRLALASYSPTPQLSPCVRSSPPYTLLFELGGAFEVATQPLLLTILLLALLRTCDG